MTEPDDPVLRFRDVPELLRFCRDRYPGTTAQVMTHPQRGEERLIVSRGRKVVLDRLVVHFEGERRFAVRLPEGLSLHGD